MIFSSIIPSDTPRPCYFNQMMRVRPARDRRGRKGRQCLNLPSKKAKSEEQSKSVGDQLVEVRALVGTIELALAASPTTARRRTEVRGMALMAVQRLRKLVSALLEEP